MVMVAMLVARLALSGVLPEATAPAPPLVLGAPARVVRSPLEVTFDEAPRLALAPEGDSALLSAVESTGAAGGASKPITHYSWLDLRAGSQEVKRFYLCERPGTVELQSQRCASAVNQAFLVGRELLAVVLTPARVPSARSSLILVDLVTGASGAPHELKGRHFELQVHPAGAGTAWLFPPDGDSLSLVELASGRELRTLTMPPGDAAVTERFFTVDGKVPVLLDSRGVLCRAGAAGWTCRKGLSPILGRAPVGDDSGLSTRIITSLSVGGRWAVLRTAGAVEVVDVETNVTLRRWRQPAGLDALAISAGGKGTAVLVGSSFDVEVAAFELKGGGALAPERLHRGTVTSLRWAGHDRLLAGDAAGGLVTWDLEKRTGRRVEPPFVIGPMRAIALDRRGEPWTLHGPRLSEDVKVQEPAVNAVFRWSLALSKATLVVSPPLPFPPWASSHACAGSGEADGDGCEEKWRMLGSPHKSPAADRWRAQQICRTPITESLSRGEPSLGHAWVPSTAPLEQLLGSLWVAPDGKRLVTWDSEASEEGPFSRWSALKRARCLESVELPGVRFACSSRSPLARGPVHYLGDGVALLDETLAEQNRVAAPEGAWGCDVAAGGTLIVSLPGEVHLWEGAAGAARVIRARPGVRSRRALDRRAWVELTASELWLRQLPEGALRIFDFASLDDTPTALDVSADGSLVAVGTQRGRVLIFARP